jgi:hypothetical protein
VCDPLGCDAIALLIVVGCYKRCEIGFKEHRNTLGFFNIMNGIHLVWTKLYSSGTTRI